MAAQQKKCVSTIYGPSESDTDSHLTLDHDTHNNSNYVTHSASQDSKNEGSKCGNCNENEIQGDSLRKETMVVFIWYLGTKDNCGVYPKLLRVNIKNVLEALLWLKKHNP